jgi:hypothetical protein
MGDHKGVRPRAVVRDQKPTTASLSEGMQSVTSCRLRELADDYVVAALQQLAQSFVLRQFALQPMSINAKHLCIDLYDGIPDETFDPVERRQASDAFES